MQHFSRRKEDEYEANNYWHGQGVCPFVKLVLVGAAIHHYSLVSDENLCVRLGFLFCGVYLVVRRTLEIKDVRRKVTDYEILDGWVSANIMRRGRCYRRFYVCFWFRYGPRSNPWRSSHLKLAGRWTSLRSFLWLEILPTGVNRFTHSLFHKKCPWIVPSCAVVLAAGNLATCDGFDSIIHARW